jgi:hypothetical protein
MLEQFKECHLVGNEVQDREISRDHVGVSVGRQIRNGNIPVLQFVMAIFVQICPILSARFVDKNLESAFSVGSRVDAGPCAEVKYRPLVRRKLIYQKLKPLADLAVPRGGEHKIVIRSALMHD